MPRFFDDPFGAAFIAKGPPQTCEENAPDNVHRHWRWRHYAGPRSADGYAVFLAELSLPSPYNHANLAWSSRDDGVLCLEIEKAARAAAHHRIGQATAEDDGQATSPPFRMDQVALERNDWLQAALKVRRARMAHPAPPAALLSSLARQVLQEALWYDLC
jgi:hypothetical protein